MPLTTRFLCRGVKDAAGKESPWSRGIAVIARDLKTFFRRESTRMNANQEIGWRGQQERIHAGLAPYVVRSLAIPRGHGGHGDSSCYPHKNGQVSSHWGWWVHWLQHCPLSG